MGQGQYGLPAAGQGREPGVEDPRRVDPASLRGPIRPRERGGHDASEGSAHFRKNKERIGTTPHGKPGRSRRCSQVNK